VSFNWKGEKFTRPDDYRRISLTFRTIAAKQNSSDREEDEEEQEGGNEDATHEQVKRSNKKIKT
jgi:hypothetical protein